MKRQSMLIASILILLMGIWVAIGIREAYKYINRPEFAPVTDQIVETIPDSGIPDVTGRKKGLVRFSSTGLFKTDAERREWLEKWAHDKETGLRTKDAALDPSRSVEEAFGAHRIVPTIGGAEDEAPFYSDPVEYAYVPQSGSQEWGYIGHGFVIIPDGTCACVCCPCCPCPEYVTPPEGTRPISIPPEELYPPVKPPVKPPIEPPVDPPEPPKVPEGSTLWMLAIGLAALKGYNVQMM